MTAAQSYNEDRASCYPPEQAFASIGDEFQIGERVTSVHRDDVEKGCSDPNDERRCELNKSLYRGVTDVACYIWVNDKNVEGANNV